MAETAALFLGDVVALGPSPMGPAIDDASGKSAVASRKTAAEKSLTSDVFAALDIALKDPPYGASEAIRIASAEVVGKVIQAVKEKEVESVVGKLSQDQGDILMKYIYRLLESSDPAAAGSYLKMHAALTEKFGLGAITRTFTDSPAL